MKKFSLILCICMLSMGLFAQDFKYRAHAPSVFVPRQSAMGGAHVTDASDFYSMYRNPAALAVVGKKKLWPGLAVGAGGPFSDLLVIYNKAQGGSQNELSSALVDAIAKNKGLNLGVDLVLPLTFGGINKNFGWGFTNRVYVSADVPSINFSEVYGGAELLLQFGYAYPVIKTDMHVLSLGLGLKGYYQMEAAINESPLNLMNMDMSKLPVYHTFGFGFDAGILYNFAKILNVGLAWKDLYTPAFTSKNDIQNIVGKSEYKLKYQAVPSDLTFGIGANIPVSWSKGVISSWSVMTDYGDIISSFDPLSRNPILNWSAGTELVLFKVLALRVGFDEMYLNTGFGLNLGPFKLDASVYGRELGLEPGSKPQFNFALAMGFHY